MADVVDPLQLFVERGLVPELQLAPTQGMAGGRVQAALARRSGTGGERLPPVEFLGALMNAPGRSAAGDQPRSPSALVKRLACERSALARVSNQSAISSKPSPRAALAMPGYMSVYS